MDKNTGSAPMPSGMHDLDGEEISTTVTENKQQLQPEEHIDFLLRRLDAVELARMFECPDLEMSQKTSDRDKGHHRGAITTIH